MCIRDRPSILAGRRHLIAGVLLAQLTGPAHLALTSEGGLGPTQAILARCAVLARRREAGWRRRAVGPAPAADAAARVLPLLVDALPPISARGGRALINLFFAVRAEEPVAATAAVRAGLVRAGAAVPARAARALVDIDLAARSDEPLVADAAACLLYTSPSPRDATLSRMPSSA